MEQKKNILIFGHYGVPNWGDEEILKGILSQLPKEKFQVTVVTHNKKFTKKHFPQVKTIHPFPLGFRSLFRGGIFSFFQSIKQSDYIIFGGGGLFQEKPQKAFFIWHTYAKICAQYKKKIFVLGNSFEMLSQKNQKKLQILSKNIEFFSVRDPFSKKFLEKIVPNKKISNTTDAAYFNASPAKKGKRKGILLAIRNGEIETNLLKQIVKKINKIHPKAPIEFIVMQSNNSADEKVGEILKLPTFTPKSVEEVEKKIKNAKFIISSRLHASIIANIQKTPFFALSPREKISNFFLKNFYITPTDLVKNSGQKKLKKFLENPEKFLELQQKFLEKNRKNLKNFFPKDLK